MKLSQKAAIKYILLSFIVTLGALVLNVCDLSFHVYKFKNNTQYDIDVTVNKDYTLVGKDGADDVECKKSVVIQLTSKESPEFSSAEINVYGSDSLDFSWTSISESENANIYSKVDGNTVTFEEIKN